MILKEQEDSRQDLQTLRRLLAHPAADEATRFKIEAQIRRLQSGTRGEAEAAYQIGFYYAGNPDWVVIHDLRLEHEGLVAQIDHLLINRIFDIWICESKRFSRGVSINEHGEFSTSYEGKLRGQNSPIEQNKRHAKLLERIIAAGRIRLPSRLGITLRPRLRSLVLVSEGAIVRPDQPLAGIETVIKNDQLHTTIARDGETIGLSALPRFVSRSTILDVGRQLVAMHQPSTRNWAAQFRLIDPPREQPEPRSRKLGVNGARTPAGKPVTETCNRCAAPLSSGVADYCMANAAALAGRYLCMPCQRLESAGQQR